MKADDATIGNELTIAVQASLNHRHAVNYMNKSHAGMFAAIERPVPAGNIYIHWNQNGCHEQSKRHMKRTATVVQSGKDAKQDEDKKGSRCCETKHEEQGRDANAYRDLNETRSRRLVGFRIHNDA